MIEKLQDFLDSCLAWSYLLCALAAVSVFLFLLAFPPSVRAQAGGPWFLMAYCGAELRPGQVAGDVLDECPGEVLSAEISAYTNDCESQGPDEGTWFGAGPVSEAVCPSEMWCWSPMPAQSGNVPVSSCWAQFENSFEAPTSGGLAPGGGASSPSASVSQASFDGFASLVFAGIALFSFSAGWRIGSGIV